MVDIFLKWKYIEIVVELFSQISQTLTHHNYPAGHTNIIRFYIHYRYFTWWNGVSGNTCFDCNSGTLVCWGIYLEIFSHYFIRISTIWRLALYLGGLFVGLVMLNNGMAGKWLDTESCNVSIYRCDYRKCDSQTNVWFITKFKELIKTIICTGYEFSYSHNASDDELMKSPIYGVETGGHSAIIQLILMLLPSFLLIFC